MCRSQGQWEEQLNLKEAKSKSQPVHELLLQFIEIKHRSECRKDEAYNSQSYSTMSHGEISIEVPEERPYNYTYFPLILIAMKGGMSTKLTGK